MVEVGLPARVAFTALNQRLSVPVLGEVTAVSADRFEDLNTGLPYYLAKIRLNAVTDAWEEPITLKAGMNAEVMIVTGERTLLTYITQPLVQSMRRAMREE